MNLSLQRLHFMSLLNRLLNQGLTALSLSSKLAAIVFVASAWSAFVRADDSEQFFESQIRPLLIEQCLECHNAEKTVWWPATGLPRAYSEGRRFWCGDDSR